MDIRAGLLLRDLGITSRYSGYKFLLDAILLAVENKEGLDHITKDIYPELAKQHQVSVWMIETDIRKVIESCWKKTNPERLQKFFSEKAYGKRPTNTEFIGCLADYLRTDEQK